MITIIFCNFMWCSIILYGKSFPKISIKKKKICEYGFFIPHIYEIRVYLQYKFIQDQLLYFSSYSPHMRFEFELDFVSLHQNTQKSKERFTDGQYINDEFTCGFRKFEWRNENETYVYLAKCNLGMRIKCVGST